ncbi:MAG: hypothetical protein JKY96_08035 [Phycisphaerales bacterium]|nr:hypothetical protein [Phycisphaerales bacterium]
MTQEAAQLLMHLGRGVRPFDPLDQAPIPVTEIDFSAMLTRARAGNPESGFPVHLTAELDRELDIEQRKALGIAVDRVMVVGSDQALVQLDERVLRVDVRTRTVLEEIEQSHHDAVSGIDAYIRAPSEENNADLVEQQPSSLRISGIIGISGLARGVRNASLVRSLPENASV